LRGFAAKIFQTVENNREGVVARVREMVLMEGDN
jgi:hypothetical protein